MGSLPTAADLPDSLTDLDQWVCWREQERDGKQTKVPLNPHRGVFASTTDPDSWGSFETARRFAADGSAAGIGFVFTDEDPFVGVDLDDCRVPETGSLTEDAAAIVDELDSYTEVSPSGTGVHVLVSGKLPDGRNRRDWVECYETSRFFTVSGEHIEGTPTEIEPRTEELARIHGEYLAPDESGPSTGTEVEGTDEKKSETKTVLDEERGGASSLSDTAVVERAQNAANGEKFSRLWRGSTTGYDSHSEADMALCSILAFWTAGDADQIDRLFRESGLMRPKWDEQHYADGSTYGEKTIERVVASTDEVYDPGSAAGESTTSADAASEAPPEPDEADAVSPPTSPEATAPSASTGGQHTLTDSPSGESGDSGQPHGLSPEAGPTPDIDGSTAASESTLQTPAGLPSGADDEVMSVVEDLQREVERLDAENKRLREQLESQSEATDGPSDESELSRFARLTRWLRS